MNRPYILNELPISSEDEDIFNFSPYVKKIDAIIQKNSNQVEPLTIGIYGRWGEGKTSFLNLLEKNLSVYKDDGKSKRILKYHFNPWRYSTEDEMLFDFFNGLSRTLKIQENSSLQKAAKHINKLVSYLSGLKIASSIGLPEIIGSTIGFNIIDFTKNLAEKISTKKKSLEDHYKEINVALENSNYKIVVIIDDIDRLDKDEIYAMFKIIKINANFKNLIYIISLDSEQVSKAIRHRYGKDKQDGKLFIEKIINIPIVLPRIEKEDLQLFFDKKISDLNRLLQLGKDDQFKEIAFEFRRFPFNNPREIIRVINSFTIAAFAIGDEVNLRDLFWIEYLKVTNENCYNDIKNYNEETLIFSEMSGIVDFNDDFNKQSKPNGFRSYLIEAYPKAESIINHLFPTNSFQADGNKVDTKILDKELKINSSEHFEKFFSYHTVRKISETNIRNIKYLISEGNIEGLKLAVHNLFSKHAEYKTLYKIENLIEDIKSSELLFFSDFLISNINLIPDLGEDMFGRSFRIRLIEKVASVLNENEVVNDYLIELGDKMTLFNLCYFTRKFTVENKKEGLYQQIINKAKLEDKPFYEEPLNAPNKMIMQTWKNKRSLEFDEFIEKTIQKDNVLLLIRNFPAFWNNTHFGALTESNYSFMKSVLNVDLVYDKVKEFYPELLNDVKFNDIEFNESDEHTLEQNAKQFVYWYNKERLAELNFSQSS